MSPAEPRLAVPAPDLPDEALVHEAGAEPAEREARQLRLVRQQARRRAGRRRLFVSGGITLAAAVCMALVALHVLIAENQFTLDRLQQQTSAQQATYEKLRLSVAELESPYRIVSVAEGLGLQAPASVTYLPATSGRIAVASSTAGTTSSRGKLHSRGAGSGTTVPAPPGDANWPSVKHYLSGTP